MARHSDLTASRSHEPAFHSATDPALTVDNRVTAGKFWVDITTPSAPILYVRNEANSAWVIVSSGSTFTDTTFAINDVTVPTKQIKFDAAGTASTSTTILSSQTTNKILTMPDATDTFTVNALAQTLTNKTLTSPIISTISNTGTITLPTATTTLVGTGTSDTLTNKTIDSSTNTVKADKLTTSGAAVVVSAAAPPSTGQVLTATSATAANWQTPSGGSGMSIYKQTTGGATTIGNSSTITTPLMALGRVTIPASTTQTVTLNKGGSAASNIYSVMLTTKGNWSNLVYLEDVAGNVFPIAASTITINNNDSVSHDVYVMAIID